MSPAMNPKSRRRKLAKKTAGTIRAEEMRADGNKLTDSERERLGEEFMKLYYSGEPKPAPARRR